MRTIRLIVRGSVQGVGFREYACRIAQRCNVTGQARNLPDGAVEVLVQGPHAEEMEAQLRHDPPGRVAAISSEILDRPAFESFKRL